VEANRPALTPTPDDIRRIVGIANPVIRNLEITYCYSRLSAAFAAHTGDGANWCTFATWASRQSGRTIRGEDLIEYLEFKLGERRWLLHPLATLGRRLVRRGLFQPETRLGRLTAALHTPFDAFERASDAVARGNRKVFEEIGFEFARFLHECPPDDEGASRLQSFVDGLRPGDPPEGQRYLRQAFARYERRRLERDPKTRAELAVLANLEIGLHEQTRLQPEIRAALDSAYSTPEDLGRRALVAVVQGRRSGGRSSAGRQLRSRERWQQPHSGARAGSRGRQSRSRSWCSRYRDACWRSARTWQTRTQRRSPSRSTPT